MTVEEIYHEKKWVANTNVFGLWIVGPEEGGLIGVLGMGRTLDEAYQMALRAKA